MSTRVGLKPAGNIVGEAKQAEASNLQSETSSLSGLHLTRIF